MSLARHIVTQLRPYAEGAVIRKMPRNPLRSWAHLAAAFLGLAWLACSGASAQRSPVAPADISSPDSRAAEDSLPDAPLPNISVAPANDREATADGTPPQNQRPISPGFPPVSQLPSRRLPAARGEHPSIPSLPPVCQMNLCTSTPNNLCCAHDIDVDYFQRFVETGIHPLTPREKGILAFRNTVDPYNFATIGFFSAVSVASDPNSAYGPGMPGFARNFGVAYCETAVGEFFGTFLIPSLVHQDPHYHRLPNASYARRTLHAITQVGWTQSDYGTGMPNYSTLLTTAIGDGLGNLYVPGRDKSWGAAAARWGTAIATDPIDNFISEFLPDVARRVNVRIVLLQQIVNHVARQD
jgi:hypothetical protein